MARDAWPDMAVRGRHAAEPAESFSGQATKAAESTTPAFHRLEQDLAKALKIDLPEAKEAVAVLQLQGYIEPAGRTGKWRTTEQGELVCGAKPARFTRPSVETALPVFAIASKLRMTTRMLLTK